MPVIEKILVPLDGTEFAEKALPYAENLAQMYQAELILVQSLQPMLVVSSYVSNPVAFYGPQLRRQKDAANVYLKSVQRKLSMPARTAILEGRPIADAIVEKAIQETVSIIVMTKHNRSGLSRLWETHVADEVFERAHCPVFMVKVPKMEAWFN